MTRRNRQTRALMENTGPRPGATFRQSVRLWQARYQAERAAQAAPPEEDQSGSRYPAPIPRWSWPLAGYGGPLLPSPARSNLA